MCVCVSKYCGFTYEMIIFSGDSHISEIDKINNVADNSNKNVIGEKKAILMKTKHRYVHERKDDPQLLSLVRSKTSCVCQLCEPSTS